MAAFKNITGQRFVRWTAVSYVFAHRWLCRCDCGNTAIVHASNLKAGRSKSCGCYRSEQNSANNATHRKTGTREYGSWKHAKERCANPKVAHFDRYGGRGITMCAAWRDSFETFLNDMGPCPKGCEIDRIDNDGNYEPGNCRWATRTAQVRNTSVTTMITHEGITLSLGDWSERTGIKIGTLHSRMARGLPLFAVVTRGYHPPRYIR